jgi:cyclically-permuted mutarotase family protein
VNTSCKFLFVALGLCFSYAGMAQKKYQQPIVWHEAGVLPTINMQQPHVGLSGTICGIIGNELLIGGGNNFPAGLPWEGGTKKYYNDVFVYSMYNDSLFHTASFKLPSNVSYAAIAQTPDKIMYAGGENETGAINTVYSIQKKHGASGFEVITWPSLPEALTNAVAVASNAALYVFGGANSKGVSDNVWALYFDKITAGWKHVSDMPQPTSFAAASLLNGQVYIMGGRCKEADGISKIYNQVFAWDIENNTWYEKASLPETVSAATAVTTNDSSILFIGGDKIVVFHDVELLAAKIAATSDTTIKKELTSIKNNLQKTHPGFSKDVLKYNRVSNTWGPYAQLSFTAPVTTHAFINNSKIYLPAGEIKPGIRTPKIWVGAIKK